jgi:hypothetical protein
MSTVQVDLQSTLDVELSLVGDNGSVSLQLQIALRGEGIPPGGLTGQILAKQSNADFDYEWIDLSADLDLVLVNTMAFAAING